MRETQKRGIALLPTGLNPKTAEARSVHVYYDNRLIDLTSTQDIDALSQRLFIETAKVGSSILVSYDPFNTFFVFGSLDISGTKTAYFYHDSRLDGCLDQQMLRSCLDAEYSDYNEPLNQNQLI